MKRSFDRAGAAARARFRQRRPLGRYRYVRLRWRVLFALVDGLGRLLVRATAAIRDRLACAIAVSAGEPRSILLVQLDHLGDAVITTTILNDLRRHYPQARIEVLASECNRDLFAACGQIDRIHVARVNRFRRGFRAGWLVSMLWWGWKLRRRRFDLAIDARGEFPLALILWLTGARRRLGWDCGGGGFLLTDRARYVPGQPEVESRLALLEALGIEPGEALRAKEPWFAPGPAARRRMGWELTRLGEATQPVVVFHIGAGTPAKQWPVESWRELLGRIIVEHGARVVLVGVAEDTPIAQAITDGLEWPGVADWTGRLGIAETAALLQRARLFVGADSGPAHLAAAVGTPSVVLFSGTNDPRQWRPWSARLAVVRHEVACSPCHRQTCPWSEHPCMRRLTPEAVMCQIDGVWRSADERPAHRLAGIRAGRRRRRDNLEHTLSARCASAMDDHPP